MYFSQQFIDEVSSRTDIADVVGKTVKLTKKNAGQYIGLCPFHNEKSPSFNVNSAKNFYHCFGCGEHGNAINFVMKTQGLSFVETISQFATDAGMELPKNNHGDAEKYNKIKSLYEVTDAAAKWFSKQLTLIDGRTNALPYLNKRGISENELNVFRIGYAPARGASLTKTLLQSGFSLEQLIETGLTIQPEDNNKKPYDRFRGRVIFPIIDEKNRVIAFGGRIIGDGKPKYLNSPETPLFHKSNVLYSLNNARAEAYQQKNIVVVEGYMDVIALYKAGIKNAVAPLGTAMTDTHLAILWKTCQEPTICLDGDNAGRKAMLKVAENSLAYLRPGYSIKFALLPESEDPDNVINNQGVSFFQSILSDAKPLSEMLWDNFSSNIQQNTPEQKAYFEDTIHDLTQQIKDSNVQSYYSKYFKNKLWESTRYSNKGNSKNINNYQNSYFKKQAPVKKIANIAKSDNLTNYENIIISILISHPMLLSNAKIDDELNNILFQNDSLADIYSVISDLYEADPNVTSTILLDKLRDSKEYPYLQSKIRILLNNTENFAISQISIEYNFLCRQLELLTNECNQAFLSNKNMTGEQLQKVFELQKQQDILKKLVKNKYLAYELAVDE